MIYADVQSKSDHKQRLPAASFFKNENPDDQLPGLLAGQAGLMTQLPPPTYQLPVCSGVLCLDLPF